MPDQQPDGQVGVAAVAGQVLSLGREVESLRRIVDTHRGRFHGVDDQLGQIESRVGSLAATLAGVADQLAELATGSDGLARHMSWFEMDDRELAYARLRDLMTWLDRVYLQFPDAVLPTCWLWHPSLVEELLWLRRSWLEAFTGRSAAIFRVADWHDRQRPGVVARIRALNSGVCSLDQHERGAEQDRRPATVPIAGAADGMAAWWTADREDAPPYPTDEQLVQAAGRQ
jgi:hypothetical protein